MERHLSSYTLWILCVDEDAYIVLQRLNLSNVRLLRLSEFEDPGLLSVKQSRTVAEYCWTLTPYAPRFVFESDESVERVTYIDADLWFRKSPEIIFNEFDASGKSVLITDHAYSPEYDQSATSGQFCVQFMTFRRNYGEYVRNWWEEHCLDWCFAKHEDGKFGDQKYLDDWPDLFSDYVHVLQRFHLTLAPWNATRFPYGSAVFFHFHGLRITSSDTIEIGNYIIPNKLFDNVYIPYLMDLRSAVDQLSRVGHPLVPQSSPLRFSSRFLRFLKRIRLLLFPEIRSSQCSF